MALRQRGTRLLSPELIAILGVGIALAGLLLRPNARIDRVESSLSARIHRMESGLSARIDRVESGLSARIDSLEGGLNARIDGIQAELREVRDRLARLEGKVDILRDYIMRRNDPAPAAE